MQEEVKNKLPDRDGVKVQQLLVFVSENGVILACCLQPSVQKICMKVNTD